MKLLLRMTIPVVAVCAAVNAQASGGWFEEAPPTLPFYLDRLPAKTIQELDAEQDGSSATPVFDFRKELAALTERAKSEDPAHLVAKVDELLRGLRNPATWQENGASLANLLHDVRDLFSASSRPQTNEMIAYLEWRVAKEFADSKKERSSRWDRPDEGQLTTEIEEHLRTSSPQLRPHWLYLRGAALFHVSDVRSQEAFEQLLTEFPDHPRAEAALFMDARCQLSAPGAAITRSASRVWWRRIFHARTRLFQSYPR